MSKLCEVCGSTMIKGRWGMFCPQYKQADHKGANKAKKVDSVPASVPDYSIMRWSPEQTVIREAILDPNSHDCIEVNATAGSGKSTTIAGVIHSLYQVKPTARVLVVAFGSRDKEDMRAKLATTAADVHSYNSFGLQILRQAMPQHRNWKPNNSKNFDILKEAIGNAELKRGEQGSIIRLIDLLKQNLLDPTAANIADICDTYEIETLSELAMSYVPTVFNLSIKLPLVSKYGTTYTDQWHLPVYHGMESRKYDYVFIDESQDINLANRKLVFKAVSERTRVIYVGDRNQAIYAWRGASVASMDEIRADLETDFGKTVVSYPMRETRRCPSSHCVMVNGFMGQDTINPHESNREGTIEDFSQQTFYNDIIPDLRTALILCRVNAPLISGCLALLARKIPCCIRGKDLGYELLNIVDRVADKTTDINVFLDRLEVWLADQLAKCAAAGPKAEAKAAVVQDKYECLTVLCEHSGSVAELKATVNYLFDDNRKDTIVFSTVHKAKGDEAETVAILGNPTNRSGNCFDPVWGNTEWAPRERLNCLFVALTRSKDRLIFVDSRPRDVIDA